MVLKYLEKFTTAGKFWIVNWWSGRDITNEGECGAEEEDNGQ